MCVHLWECVYLGLEAALAARPVAQANDCVRVCVRVRACVRACVSVCVKHSWGRQELNEPRLVAQAARLAELEPELDDVLTQLMGFKIR